MFREGVELFVKWNGRWFIRVGGSRVSGQKLESLISNMVFGVKRYRRRSTQRRGVEEEEESGNNPVGGKARGCFDLCGHPKH